MRYEIITDNEDTLVLVVNSRVVLISSDMDEITGTITDIYTEYMNKKKKVADKPVNKDETPDSGALTGMFGL